MLLLELPPLTSMPWPIFKGAIEAEQVAVCDASFEPTDALRQAGMK